MRTFLWVFALAIGCARAVSSPDGDRGGLARLAVADRHGPVSVTAAPADLVIERIRGNQRTSCDFRLHNDGAAVQTLRAFSVTALDASGAVLTRRSLDSHGIAPAIQMIPVRTIEPGQTLVMFDPLDMFPGDLAIAALRFRFEFVDADRTASETELAVAVRTADPALPLRVPLDGNVFVAHGHGLTDPHRRIDVEHPALRALGMTTNSARYALDLTRVDDHGRMFDGEGTRLDQWYGYGSVVRAPAAGAVLAVADRIADNRMSEAGVEFAVEPMSPSGILGNFVILQLGSAADRDVIVFAHLKAGTIRVSRGTVVKPGDPLGEIGFSGNTDFVHTHVQRMISDQAAADQPAAVVQGVLRAEGAPIYFADFDRVLGSRVVHVGLDAADTGDIIRHR